MQSGFYAEHLPGWSPMARCRWRCWTMRCGVWLKEAIGLFDDPYRRWTRRAKPMPRTMPNAALARDAARRSIVLLKNDGPLLPLRSRAEDRVDRSVRAGHRQHGRPLDAVRRQDRRVSWKPACARDGEGAAGGGDGL
jgi:beta-glucosidase-like glycosyl hydrolase